MSWLDDPLAWMVGVPPLALLLFVFAAAALEYIFPPTPGDTAILLGFFLAGQGAAPPAQVYAAALVGGFLGAWCAYLLGERYGMRLIRKITRWRISLFRRRPVVSRERLVELFQRFDERVLLINRFVPVARTVAIYGAGALKLRLGPTLVYCAISHTVFMAMLLWIGLLTAGSWDQILANAQRYNRLVGAMVLVVLGVWLVLGIRRTRRPKT